MNKVMIETPYGIRVTDNDAMLEDTLKSLVRNNTFCPNITRIIYNTKKNEDKGDYVLATTVFFSDGTKTTVKNILNDKISTINEIVTFSDGSSTEVVTASRESREVGLVYAILKRMICVPTNEGLVEGNGFVNFLRKKIDSAWVQDVEEVRSDTNEKLRKKALNDCNGAKKKQKTEKRSLSKCLRELSEMITDMKSKK